MQVRGVRSGSLMRWAALPPRALGLVSAAWVLALSALYLPAWNPVWLFTRQLPALPLDVAAAAAALVRDGLRPLAALALLSAAAVGAGDLALAAFRVELARGERLLLSCGLGLGVLAYAVLLVGVTAGFGALGWGALLLLLAVAAVAGARALGAAARGAARPAPGTLEIAFVVSFALVAVFVLGKALKPAVFYDAVTYHLGVPKFFLLEGGVRYIPWDSCSNFPLTAEMISTLGLMLSGPQLAQLAATLPFLLSAFAVRVLAARLGDVSGALAGLFFLLTPGLLESAVLSANDTHLALFFLLAAASFLLWNERGGPGLLPLAGVFTGLCLGTKYTALALVLPPAALAAAFAARAGARQGRALRNVFALALPALLTWAPWPLRNLVNTGNPFYPAGYQLFGGKDMSAGQYAGILSLAHRPDLADSLRGLFLHPWRLFFLEPGQMAARYGNGAHLGLLVPLFVPLLVLARGRPPALRGLLLAAGLVFVAWDFSFVQTRYFYPGAALLVVAAASSFAAARRAVPRPFGLLLAGVAALHLLFNACAGFRMVDTWTAATGFQFSGESDDAYLLRRMVLGQGAILDSYPAYRYVNERLPRDARVLVVGDAQHLYLDRRHLYAYLSATTPFQVFVDAGGRQERIAAWLASERITHVVYNPGELRRLQREGALSFPAEGNARVEEFLAGPHVRLLMSTRPPALPVFLYEVVGEPPRAAGASTEASSSVSLFTFSIADHGM